MQDNTQIILMLGRIQGTLDSVQKNIDDHTDMLHAMDNRLRSVEQRSAIHGAAGGSLAAIAVSALVQLIKARLEVVG